MWLHDASVACFHGRWQSPAFALIAVMAPVPLGMVAFLLRLRKDRVTHLAGGDSEQRHTDKEVADGWPAIRQVLTSGFRDERQWWLAVSLYRRWAAETLSRLSRSIFTIHKV